jgi:catechol 2,3-dioxygenase-like lactoylglutathione lyase family enzyme
VPSRLTDVVFDCDDPDRIGAFWCAALGYQRVNGGDGWLVIGPSGGELTGDDLRARPQPPSMAFVVVPEGKAVKNRLHIDITPFDASQDDEVERLVGLGASRVDVGQGDEEWVVLADPEGNEFCVMAEADDADSADS